MSIRHSWSVLSAIFLLGIASAGETSAKTLYGAQIRVDGQSVPRLGFVVADSTGPVLVIVKPPGRAEDGPPLIRSLASPEPPPFAIGRLLNLGSQTNEVSVQYFSLKDAAPGLAPFSLGRIPDGDGALLIWDAAQRRPVVVAAQIEGESMLRVSAPLFPIQILGAPLCTKDGLAHGVVVAAGDTPLTWRFARIEDRSAASRDTQRSDVPLSRAPSPLRIVPLTKQNTRIALSVTPSERPRVEIRGIAGEVVFRTRNARDDRTFKMLDPEFQRAVRGRALDKLLPDAGFAYTELGTLDVPVKVVDFPLLGQDDTATCWVAHYREWLFYYLGTRHEYVPALEDLRGYLNLLLSSPTLEGMFDPEARKRASRFDGGGGSGSFASRNSIEMRKNLSDLFRVLLVGPETEPYLAFTDITEPSIELDSDRRSRRLSEAEFGGIMQGLLLGQMTLGRSESHVMNIIGVAGDELMISTWAKEFKGSLRQLARMDRRGPVLVPLEFTQHPIVARAQDGHVVIPTLDPARSPGLGARELRAVERFNAGE